MLKTTPFHARAEALNETMLWRHWAGHAVADRYQMSTKREYYAVRDGAGLADTSPLYKYRFSGRDAERFLAGVLARDVRRCPADGAQYTMWLDDRGFVVEDGVVLRVAPDEFLLTSAEPNMAWFTRMAGRRAVEIDDVSDDYGILAVQGPRSREILGELVPETAGLGSFRLVKAKVGGAPVVVSRTGYTGGLGFEVWVERDDALAVWDAVVAAGRGRGLVPYGSVVLHMARIEAGLLLVGVDYRPSRFAWTEDQRASPVELGYGWMFRHLADDDRAFVGRAAVAAELRARSSRWRRVGLAVDRRDFEHTHRKLGLLAPQDHEPVDEAMAVYAPGGAQVGFATSFMFSPLLKRHVAIARVPPALARPGSALSLELIADHRPYAVDATVARLPFIGPLRREARPEGTL